tara:strand:+ start:2966 stop:3964 length:999 start_codon:yes stop_codon:yes gene_type:complete
MLVLENIHFKYKEPLLQNIHLRLAPGKLMALTGASGSGKSTLLKLIYGSLTPEKGHIQWKKEALLGPEYNLLPGAPFLRYLAQDFDLMPFTSVAENISQHLSVFEPEALEKRTRELLQLIDMEAFANTQVKNLSGGQQQRVALAKVLAKAPELILLDEPFSHIDPPLKLLLRTKLFDYLKQHKIACILASHHPEDYMGHAHEVVCMEGGKIIASGAPESLYQNPPSTQVAQLFGVLNILDKATILSLYPTLKIKEGQEIVIWPHEWSFNSGNGIAVRVEKSVFIGNGYLVVFKSKDGQRFYMNSKTAFSKNEKKCVNVSQEHCEQRLKSLAM